MKSILFFLFFYSFTAFSASRKKNLCKDQATVKILNDYQFSERYADDLRQAIVKSKVTKERGKIVRRAYDYTSLDLDEITRKLFKELEDSEEVDEEFTQVLIPVLQFQKNLQKLGIDRLLAGPIPGYTSEELSILRKDITDNEIKVDFYPIQADAIYDATEKKIMVNSYRYLLKEQLPMVIAAIAHEVEHEKGNHLFKFTAKENMTAADFTDANWQAFRDDEARATARGDLYLAKPLRAGVLTLAIIEQTFGPGMRVFIEEYLDRNMDHQPENIQLQFYRDYLDGRGRNQPFSVVLEKTYRDNATDYFSHIFKIISGIANRGKTNISIIDGMSRSDYHLKYGY